MEYLEFKNKYRMPLLGYGTFLIDGVDSNEAKESVSYALKIGYRHIDTAWVYRNESQIGEAISESKIKRKDLFITTKYAMVANSVTPGFIEYCIHQQLKRLRTDYIDLYLIHWPITKNYNAMVWKVLEGLYDKGVLKLIGVSNFWRHHLSDLFESAKIKPFINQLHISPYYYPYKLIEYCKKHQIQLTGYSFFKSGELNNEVIKKIAYRKNVTPAQVILKWGIQQKIVMIPKSVTKTRIFENYKVFDFYLSTKEISQITSLSDGNHQMWNPESVDFSGVLW